MMIDAFTLLHACLATVCVGAWLTERRFNKLSQKTKILFEVCSTTSNLSYARFCELSKRISKLEQVELPTPQPAQTPAKRKSKAHGVAGAKT